ncbi:MAG: sulfotransferase family protein [Micavibrio sp.]|nr:sulfotransferase family protein [Micavibrio sp.]
MLPKPVRKIYYALAGSGPIGNALAYFVTFLYHAYLVVFRIEPKQDRTALLIVSHKYKFIYIGVPKVASRAFMGALIEKGQAKYESEWFETTADFKRVLAQYPDYFKFSIVRNPWARIVSCYNSKIGEGITYSKYVRIMAAYKTLKAGMAFDDFVRWLCTPMGADANADRHWLSQYVLLTHKNGEPICDYVGRYENLEEEIKVICGKIGVEPFKLPQRGHLSSTKDYKSYYMDETAALIKQRYAKDCELYGYEYEP